MRAFATLCCLLVLAGVLHAEPTGYPGRTATTSLGCGGCHGGSASTRTTVTLEAPKKTLAPGEVGTFTVVVAHATYPGAGVGIAVRTSETGSTNAGTLAVTSGTGLRVRNGEITHSSTRQITGGSVRLTFTWTAPTTPGTYYIQAIGNAVNGNGRDDGSDNWAFMTPQAITVEPSTSVDEEAALPLAVFPNPLRGDASLYLGADISGATRVQLISTAGDVVMDNMLNIERGQLPTSLATLPRGVYAIIASQGSLVRRGRVVIE
jgi:hypothetical protein